MPVNGINYFDLESDQLRKEVVLVDVRDYNGATKLPVEGVIHLPFAYIKRHFREIKSKEVVLVVSDPILLNLSVRFLRRKGFHVIGCYRPDHLVIQESEVKQVKA
ncbi:hypothetical protein JCM9157_2647 [Halalkalibacter akibai JCM 9157]|uniref:Sulfurtransferase n=1 Tax=Halalkalibacter akibai (strain ATCC 43226 / DSM 21942 / CIP 109018 / JCM 9157 / 1139) TaxID=1236973 RepID=W4QTP7_HALA3|nr:hypothetical protein JCM9157_2647 [Halalkalibacter akibai JCM 9157]